ncbi:MAG: glycoside hydrolase family 38 [Chthoniobacterales bacterium]|nr:glycoside hydrolase family 38 [Chthoniobacterales bacterium]
MSKTSRSSKPRASAPRKVHYVLSTHWDREWYQTFQDYRHRLVKLMDRTLDDIASGALRGSFTTDGQAIILDDYLEVRPERREQVLQYARNGKLKIGPWFVLPDEWLVSGESMVRNLRLGRDIARQFGAVPSDAGFVCDLFGHVGQLPQILAGFGIKGAFLWRGLEPQKEANFFWEGSDGTRMPCYQFGRAGYCDYTYDVRRSTQPDVVFDAERALKDLKGFLAKESARTNLPPMIVFDGGDHLEYDAEHYGVLFGRKTGADFPYEIVHSTLDEYLDDMIAHAGKITRVVRGELRDPGRRPHVEDFGYLIPSVLSSRVWIKQANADCQALLCHWAEPFGAMADALAGLPYPQAFLDTAWRWLLMNHPHDSICGCSIDAVHEDMKYRFAQSRQIADRQTAESLRTLAAAVEGEIGPKEFRVLVANPLATVLDEPVELTLKIPAEWLSFQEGFGFEPKPGFRIFDAAGKEVPYQRVAQALNRTKVRIRRTKYPQAYKTNDVTVCLPMQLPALGYTTLTVREGELSPKDEIVPEAMLPTRYPEWPGLATSAQSMENEFLAVMVESNGTLTLTDKRTGQIYPGLLAFEDIADIGDGWYHGQALNDQAFVSTGAAADIALEHNGPLLSRFRVRTVLRVPAEFRFDRMVRAAEFAELVIDSRITLKKGSDRLEIETTVGNAAKDHRVRVLFPSGVKAATYLADGAFDVVERDIALPGDNHLGRETAVEPRPQQTWTAVSDARRGLAVVSSGLLETCVRDLPGRPLALTLFRSTRRTVMTDGEPEGQLLGDLRFRYWVVPFRGAANRARLSNLGVLLGAGLRDEQMTAVDISLHKEQGRPELPPSASFLKVGGDVVVTSVREVDGALEVRLFNPNVKTAAATLDFRGRPKGAPTPRRAQAVNFESRPAGKSSAFTGIFKTSLKPKQILTVSFSP